MRRVIEAIVAVSIGFAAAAAPAHRIVSLSPGLTELTYAAGAGRYLVGTSAYTDYPPAATKLPRVGDAFHIDVERVVALQPDLVLAWASSDPPELIARLRQLGFKVAVFESHSLADIAANLRRIGGLAGTAAQAGKAAGAFERRVASLRRRYADESPVTVFYEISASPLYTISGDQIISQGIGLCGGRNIFAGLSTLAATVSVAAVIARDPEAIVTAGEGDNVRRRLNRWRRWPQLAAVRHDALFAVPPDDIARATPRMLNGIEAICEDLDALRNRRDNLPSPFGRGERGSLLPAELAPP